jgi:hypothetical protein
MTNFRPLLVAQLVTGLVMVLVTATVISIQISDRSSFAGSELYQDVVDRWGAPIVQAVPSVRAVESGSVFKTLESLPLEYQDVHVSAGMSYRKRGLVYFSGFEFTFQGRYQVTNNEAHDIDIAFVFPINLERNKVLLSDLTFTIGGEPGRVDLTDDTGALYWTGRLASGQSLPFEIGFRGRGLESFTYLLDPDLPVRNFRFEIEIEGGDNYDYAVGVIPASTVTAHEEGASMVWIFSSLESGVPVGVILPAERSFDEIIATMVRRAWAGYCLLAVLVQALAILDLGRPFRLHENGLIAAGYAFFFVLLAYLAAYWSFYVAYLTALLVIGGLLWWYIRHLLGGDREQLLAGALLGTLGVPTLAVILQGYTGLIYTFEILSLLAGAMWLTTRPAFHELLTAFGDSQPPPQPATQPEV